MAKPGRKRKFPEDQVRLPIRFDSELQLELMKQAAARLHWSVNRFIVQASFEVAKSIQKLAAAQAEEERRENGCKEIPQQPIENQSNRC